MKLSPHLLHHYSSHNLENYYITHILFTQKKTRALSGEHEPSVQVCESRPHNLLCAHTPSPAHSSSADSIATGAEAAAAGCVVPSVNSSALLQPELKRGFWAQKPPSQWRGKSFHPHIRLLFKKLILKKVTRDTEMA